MKTEFENFLIQQGYKEYTPKGNPSTVYDYIKRIEKVCTFENCSSMNELANIIDDIVPQYEATGAKAALGKMSHNAVICALRSFQMFCHKRG